MQSYQAALEAGCTNVNPSNTLLKPCALSCYTLCTMSSKRRKYLHYPCRCSSSSSRLYLPALVFLQVPWQSPCLERIRPFALWCHSINLKEAAPDPYGLVLLLLSLLSCSTIMHPTLMCLAGDSYISSKICRLVPDSRMLAAKVSYERGRQGLGNKGII